MAECGAPATAPKESQSILQLREKLRTKMKLSRQEHRHEGVDTIRIAIGENYTENLRAYTEDDVVKLAKALKRQKHANPHQLNQLSHAFLQSAENIQCFLNITGALNVIVKEFTGSNNDAQLLAAECVCNLSLGSEISCEKLAHHVATYLITFLKSSNERLLRTSLWTIANLMASGNKALSILVNQEVVKSLMSVKANPQNDGIKEDATIAIGVAVDTGALRLEDLLFLIESIPSTNPSTTLSFATTKILYKLLSKLNLPRSDSSLTTKGVMHRCVDTLFHLYRNIQSFPIETESDPFLHMIILLRIIGNILVIEEWAPNFLITDGFAANNVEVAQFFQDLLETMDNEASQRELLWVARNLLENKFLNQDCLAYVNRSSLNINMLIEYWRGLPNVKI